MNSTHLTISVLGLGYVGLVQAACLANAGHSVLGFDVDATRLAAVSHGVSPVAEPGLNQLLAQGVATGRLRTSRSVMAAVTDSDVSLVCVGTPTGIHGEADLSALLRCLDDIQGALTARPKPHVVVVRSTITPGTMNHHVTPRFEKIPDQNKDARPLCLFVPEFLREGSAIRDYLNPEKIIVGHDGHDEARARRIIEDLYGALDAPRYFVDFGLAELSKYTDNYWHALKVCFANEIGALSTTLGLDGDKLMTIFTLDKALNISSAYLKPGMPFGGSCLSKDVTALCHTAAAHGLQLPLLNSVIPSNEQQLERCVNNVLAVSARRVGLWGLAFKPGTRDLRNSPAIALAIRLLAHGRDLSLYDDDVDPEDLKDHLLQGYPSLADALASGTLRIECGSVLQDCDLIVMCHPSGQTGAPGMGQHVIQLY